MIALSKIRKHFIAEMVKLSGKLPGHFKQKEQPEQWPKRA